MSNVKSNTIMASSDLECFDDYDNITCFDLYYSKARMSNLLDKIEPGVCQGRSVLSSMFSHFTRPCAHAHFLPGAPLLYSASSFKTFMTLICLDTYAHQSLAQLQ